SRPAAAGASPTRWPPRRRTRSARSPPRPGRRPAAAGWGSRGCCSPPGPPHRLSVGGSGEQIEGPYGPVFLHGKGEDRRGESGGVVVDVQDDDPALEEVHPALRRADYRDLEVQEALVLIEDHLALRQLLAVYAPLSGAQLPGHVIDLQVVGARLQAECHLSRARYDAQV
uniref:Uncharacterized protein n=1 Tax=Terrapene triunguis TaxID=2587831 RepID=A0A674I1X8_9SAUR